LASALRHPSRFRRRQPATGEHGDGERAARRHPGVGGVAHRAPRREHVLQIVSSGGQVGRRSSATAGRRAGGVAADRHAVGAVGGPAHPIAPRPRIRCGGWGLAAGRGLALRRRDGRWLRQPRCRCLVRDSSRRPLVGAASASALGARARRACAGAARAARRQDLARGDGAFRGQRRRGGGRAVSLAFVVAAGRWRRRTAGGLAEDGVVQLGQFRLRALERRKRGRAFRSSGHSD